MLALYSTHPAFDGASQEDTEFRIHLRRTVEEKLQRAESVFQTNERVELEEMLQGTANDARYSAEVIE
jgi:hypothetical protein